VKVLEIYKEPEHLKPLLEQQDIFGRDCLWYITKFNMLHILDCKIMDKFIVSKWKGDIETNATVFDYSTSMTILNDQHGLFLSDKMWGTLIKQTYTFNKE
jgi:hypothetical protein